MVWRERYKETPVLLFLSRICEVYKLFTPWKFSTIRYSYLESYHALSTLRMELCVSFCLPLPFAWMDNYQKSYISLKFVHKLALDLLHVRLSTGGPSWHTHKYAEWIHTTKYSKHFCVCVCVCVCVSHLSQTWRLGFLKLNGCFFNASSTSYRETQAHSTKHMWYVCSHHSLLTYSRVWDTVCLGPGLFRILAEV